MKVTYTLVNRNADNIRYGPVDSEWGPGDMELVARDCAENLFGFGYYDLEDEADWPILFVLFDSDTDEELGRFWVNMEYLPSFSASPPLHL